MDLISPYQLHKLRRRVTDGTSLHFGIRKDRKNISMTGRVRTDKLARAEKKLVVTSVYIEVGAYALSEGTEKSHGNIGA
jgi:hypothetical protein